MDSFSFEATQKAKRNSVTCNETFAISSMFMYHLAHNCVCVFYVAECVRTEKCQDNDSPLVEPAEVYLLGE